MTFVEAVRSALSQYATFRGRARRSEFWYFFLFTILINLPTAAVDYATDTPVAGLVVAVALTVPSFAVGARRLHDTGRSGWWELLLFVPIVGFVALIVLIIWCATDSHGPNKYGPSPKDPQVLGDDRFGH